MVGMLLTGVFASSRVNPAIAENGLFYGESHLFVVHFLAMVGVAIFVFAGTWVLLKLTDLISPLRVSEEEERTGLDWSQHEEKL